MSASEEYRRKAAECLARANATIDGNERAELIVMALQWRRLSEQTAMPGRADRAAAPPGSDGAPRSEPVHGVDPDLGAPAPPDAPDC